jgi:hypothetical protein
VQSVRRKGLREVIACVPISEVVANRVRAWSRSRRAEGGGAELERSVRKIGGTLISLASALVEDAQTSDSRRILASGACACE